MDAVWIIVIIVAIVMVVLGLITATWALSNKCIHERDKRIMNATTQEEKDMIRESAWCTSSEEKNRIRDRRKAVEDCPEGDKACIIMAEANYKKDRELRDGSDGRDSETFGVGNQEVEKHGDTTTRSSWRAQLGW